MMHRRLFLAAFLTFMTVSIAPGVAQNSGSPAAEIRAVIEQQLEAFQRDDAAAAFSYASATIQDQFKTPERFMQMVRTGYRAVYRPMYVEFKNLAQDIEGNFHQHVIVQAPDGALMMAVYPMVQEANGTWRIDGCYLAPLERKAT